MLMMTNVKPIRIAAPFTGWAAPLDEVPDPVFSERMMGDGIAIDPLDGTLHAPCEARVIAVAPTGHSVTLALANGAELLIHIGLETVALQGEGFTPLVADGVQVRTGDPLIRFDMDLLAERAKSLITPIVIVNEGYRIALLACDRAVTAGEPLMEVVPIDTNVVAETPVSDDTARCDIVVPLANGIHARPAAKIVAAFKPYSADIRFVAHGREANGRSTVSLLSLGLKHGDALTISAKGHDARAAVATVAALIESGMDEGHAPQAKPVSAAAPQPIYEGPLFKGVRAAPGLALGPVVQFRPADAEIAEQGDGLAHDTAALDTAIHALGRELDSGRTGASASIAAAHLALLDDPELLGGARIWLAQGKSAAFAWRAATRAHAEAIRATGDPLLIERIADLIDIERQLIATLTGETASAMPDLPEGAILISDELLPSQFMALDASRLGGIATANGGPTSHVAILAASAGVPMLVAAGPGLLDIPAGPIAILDADAATLDSEPTSDALAESRARLASTQTRRAAEAAAAHGDCAMADGTRIEIFANLASAEEAERAVKQGAEGCGLLRTEFLFLDREDAPSEAEQQRAYAAIATALEGRPLIVRTLDIGGDKPVP